MDQPRTCLPNILPLMQGVVTRPVAYVGVVQGVVERPAPDTPESAPEVAPPEATA